MHFDFDQRIKQLRANLGRTSFNFQFEDLFDKQEWLNMSIPQRKNSEREFRIFIENHDHLRIPYTSEDHIRMHMYNSFYDYNEIKNNFKSYV
ncbi:DUF1413 domain-containing protein [Staphylococcus succinus]|uniref:DUF1413 domain-containing protein n=1 Tax=Staphylococcus succinus TaxID=61015 RepID=UPI00062BB6CA|nr:DUF1413 domain-containing protein [Staphylococcus succinus]MDH9160151.1 DUF1413 domain-containing protein [Staphylococcus succinus]PNZ19449.1 DUF1413 domain-containing protein [Staphylococcus succinus subsp. succinus]